MAFSAPSGTSGRGEPPPALVTPNAVDMGRKSRWTKEGIVNAMRMNAIMTMKSAFLKEMPLSLLMLLVESEICFSPDAADVDVDVYRTTYMGLPYA